MLLVLSLIMSLVGSSRCAAQAALEVDAQGAAAMLSTTLVERVEDSEEFTVWRLRDTSSNMSVQLCSLGATIMRLEVPDQEGALADVVLGFNDPEAYLHSSAYFGAVVGRVANRIAGARFELGGAEYTLEANNGPNTLHGGRVGFSARNWHATPVPGGVRFLLNSADGDQGFPGELEVQATYTLKGSALALEMVARLVSGPPSPINLAQHSYFNLAGHDAGQTVDDHLVTIWASHFTPLDEDMVPTGQVTAVSGTPFDLQDPQGVRVGDRLPIFSTGPEDATYGFDNNFCLGGSLDEDGLRLAARVTHPGSGRVLEVHTNAPGVQFYTGNFLDGVAGKNDATYYRHSGLCLETQHFPSSIDGRNREAFGSSSSTVLLGEGDEPYHHVVEYRFGF